MKTVMVYGGNTWRECVEMAREIAVHIQKERIYSVVLYGTNAEVITDNVRILVRTTDDKHIRGMRVDECFGFSPHIAMFIRKSGDGTYNPGSLMDYILREEGR